MTRTNKIFLILVLVFVMIISSMAGCTPAAEEVAEPTEEMTEEPTAEVVEEKEEEVEPVTIKLFTNLPDRNAGQGELEQMLIDQYMAENPHVTIEVEALQDEPYKQKFKAYTASDNLPDLVSVWGQPAFIAPVINSGYLAELNPADYDDANFIPGSMTDFSKDGKLYGLPRNTDIMVFYYNKAIFADYGIEVPTTIDELIAIGDALEGSGIAPCSVNGKDKWSLAILFTDFVLKHTGDNSLLSSAVTGQDFVSEAKILDAAKVMEKINQADFYQKSFTSADYGAARNMFAQGKAATYYMGSWEMGMVSDESLPEDFRSNIGVFSLPVDNGAAGSLTDLAAWHGGGYAVSSNSEVKEEAIKLLNYMFAPENWAKNAWQMGICFPAQNIDEFLTGEESEVQVQLIEMLSTATSTTGTPVQDVGTPSFKTAAEDLVQQFCANMITAEEFVQKLDEASKE